MLHVDRFVFECVLDNTGVAVVAAASPNKKESGTRVEDSGKTSYSASPTVESSLRLGYRGFWLKRRTRREFWTSEENQDQLEVTRNQ